MTDGLFGAKFVLILTVCFTLTFSTVTLLSIAITLDRIADQQCEAKEQSDAR